MRPKGGHRLQKVEIQLLWWLQNSRLWQHFDIINMSVRTEYMTGLEWPQLLFQPPPLWPIFWQSTKPIFLTTLLLKSWMIVCLAVHHSGSALLLDFALHSDTDTLWHAVMSWVALEWNVEGQSSWHALITNTKVDQAHHFFCGQLFIAWLCTRNYQGINVLQTPPLPSDPTHKQMVIS